MPLFRVGADLDLKEDYLKLVPLDAETRKQMIADGFGPDDDFPYPRHNSGAAQLERMEAAGYKPSQPTMVKRKGGFVLEMTLFKRVDPTLSERARQSQWRAEYIKKALDGDDFEYARRAVEFAATELAYHASILKAIAEDLEKQEAADE